MTRNALPGLALLSLLAAGCRSLPAPVIVRECPPLPDLLTASCFLAAPAPVTNGQLAEQWIGYRACAQEQSIKLAVVRELAGCRLRP